MKDLDGREKRVGLNRLWECPKQRWGATVQMGDQQGHMADRRTD